MEASQNNLMFVLSVERNEAGWYRMAERKNPPVDSGFFQTIFFGIQSASPTDRVRPSR